MTNSTSSTNQPKKAKGPIRTGVVIPTLILVILLFTYFGYFFDGHVRKGLEYAGTHIVGAEVNVGRVNISFLKASLEIDNIQVTDKEQPERNLVQIGAIRFKLLWDALLRAKAVVDEASILNIQAYSKRQHPGYIVPPTPPSPSHGPSPLTKVEGEVLAQTRKQYNGNFLGDIATILSGSDPKEQLKNIQTELKSDAKIKALQKELDDKKAAWEKRIKELPQGKELQQYADRIKVLKFDMKNPAEFAKSVQEANQIVKEAGEKVKQIDQAQKDLKSDLNSTSQNYKELEKLVQEDIKDLQGKFKIPSIDPKEFSQQLFMSMIEKKLGSLYKYVVLARKYMPPKKTKAEKLAEKEEQIVPPKRGQGKTYHFPITTGYPLFWLKHAAISSEMNDGEYSGNIKGEIRDLTTDPGLLGRPTLILAQGDFPKQGISGLNAKITLDHTGDTAKESMSVKVSSFPVALTTLSDSPEVRLALEKAKGTSDVEAVFTNEQLTMTMKNTFGDIQYKLEAKNKMVSEIIDNVLKGIPTVNVNADIKGSLSNLDIRINSNLGDDLSKGFQKQLQAKVAEAKAQLQKLIDEKIGGNKQKLKAEMDKMTGDITKQVDGKKTEADKAVKDAQNQIKSNQGGSQKKLEDEGKKLLNKVFGG